VSWTPLDLMKSVAFRPNSPPTFVGGGRRSSSSVGWGTKILNSVPVAGVAAPQPIAPQNVPHPNPPPTNVGGNQNAATKNPSLEWKGEQEKSGYSIP
jgi:hypothetical protein